LEIAEKLEKKVNGVEVDFSNTNYQYVKNLVKSEEKLNNWRDICGWLEDAGYKSQQIVQTQSDNSRNLDAKVHISNINIENQTIELGVLIQLTLPSSSDSSKKDSN
jgi:thymidine kinase